MTVVCPTNLRALCELLGSVTGNGGSSYAKNVFQQFWVLLKRNFLNNLRNPGIVWIRLFMCAAPLHRDVVLLPHNPRDTLEHICVLGCSDRGMPILSLVALVIDV